MNLYNVARQVTDEVFGEGAYAQANRNNPDPNIQKAIACAVGSDSTDDAECEE